MLEEEFGKLLLRVQQRNCEEQTLEVKAANKGCPERLYDTFSAFANQNEGGMLLFGLDEKQGFAKVGVYDAQDLQKKLMEVGESMTPVVRPVLSVYVEGAMLFVAAESSRLSEKIKSQEKITNSELRRTLAGFREAVQPDQEG